MINKKNSESEFFHDVNYLGINNTNVNRRKKVSNLKHHKSQSLNNFECVDSHNFLKDNMRDELYKNVNNYQNLEELSEE